MNEKISRNSKAVWDNYTPEQRAARVAACLQGRIVAKQLKANKQLKLALKANKKPKAVEVAPPVSEVSAAIEMLRVVQLELAQTIGFTPTLSQTVQYMEAKAKKAE